jgi:FdhD protein
VEHVPQHPQQGGVAVDKGQGGLSAWRPEPRQGRVQAGNWRDDRRPRGLPGRSGCGICGTRLLEEVVKRPACVGDGLTIDNAALEIALSALQDRQPLNKATGATHAAAWALPDGALTLVREDVGRHNALDKLIGAMLRGGVDPARGFALVTSRASYEMVTKAAVAGIGLLAAISAPTALAVDLARDCGLTLVGFVRPGRQVIYSHPHRLQASRVGAT